MAAVERVPFGELSSGRLQQLASAKNRQNGLVHQDTKMKPSMPTPSKRSYAMSNMGDDSENVDPVQFSGSKKNKVEFFSTPIKPLALTRPAMTTTLPRPARIDTIPSRTPLSAPAGRSPKRKTLGLAAKSRRAFTRIDPPFVPRSDSLPFSLDAALNNALGKSKPVPAKWKFEIHEDSPEDEAGILMEHSTLTLDLSSDDEGAKDKHDRGKENVAPEGYTMPSISSRASERSVKFTDKLDIVRKKVETDAMDDGQRTPLSDLEVEPFNTLEAGEERYIIVDAESSTNPKAEFTFSVTAPTETAPKSAAEETAPKSAAEETVQVEVSAPETPTSEATCPAKEETIAVYEDDCTPALVSANDNASAP